VGTKNCCSRTAQFAQAAQASFSALFKVARFTNRLCGERKKSRVRLLKETTALIGLITGRPA